MAYCFRALSSTDGKFCMLDTFLGQGTLEPTEGVMYLDRSDALQLGDAFIQTCLNNYSSFSLFSYKTKRFLIIINKHA